MKAFEVRSASIQDIEQLGTLWDAIMRERAQIDKRFRLADNARQVWQESLQSWLDRDNVEVLLADRQGQLIGYVILWILERPTLYHQQRYGFISDLGVDGHAHQSGIGTALLDEAKIWFASKGIDTVQVEVMHEHPIAQAFWRSKGAIPYIDHLWIKLAKVDE